MLSNRITMANLRGQDANQVGDIPPDQLALLQEEARSTLDMAKKALDWIETLIALRYEQCAIAARGAAGKDVGDRPVRRWACHRRRGLTEAR